MAIVTPGRYSGTSFAAIDGKGRVAVPASLRNNVPIADNGERVLWVGYHETLPCLVAFGSDQYDRLNDEIERDRDTARARNLDFNEDAAFKNRFGFTDPYTLDDSGRFMPNASARRMVGMDGVTAFVGSGRRFEIWWLPKLIECEIADPVLREMALEFRANPKARK